MARPRTQVGTSGAITTTGYVHDPITGRRARVTDPRRVRADVWKAHTRHRDQDGVTRLIERWAPTKAKAETALKAALLERQAPARAGDWTADLTLTVASDLWLERVTQSGRSSSTKAQYSGNRNRYLTNAAAPATPPGTPPGTRRRPCTVSGCCGSVQNLTLREANRVGTIERFLQVVADNHGIGAAKSARTILSGVLSEAVRHGVLAHNACRDVRPARPAEPRKTERDTDRAFTRRERTAVLRVADRDDGTTDTADLLHFLAGTGCRINEALTCVRWTGLALEGPYPPTVHVEGTKTANADRVLPLPTWLADRLTARADRYGTRGLVFGVTRFDTKLGEPRDVRNIARILNARMEAAGVPWATSHTFRRTVATMMDEAGAPLAEIANQLGHANVSVTAAYLGRRAAPTRAADVL